MDSMDVSRDPAVKMKGEDLAHAYDAVRVANKSVSFSIVNTWATSPVSCWHLCFHGCFRFLENQLRSQRSQQEEQLKALQQQLTGANSGSSSEAQQQVLIRHCSH